MSLKPNVWVMAAAGAIVFPGGSHLANAQWMRFRPVAATGNVICLPGEGACDENEIILSSAGVTVTLFVQLSNWDWSGNQGPIGAYQGSLDSSTFSGGIPGNPWTLDGIDLVPVGHPDMGFEGAFQSLTVCGDIFNPTTFDPLTRCQSIHDCPRGSFCIERPDYVFYQLHNTPTVSTATPNFAWSAASNHCVEDDETWKYGGTLLVGVPTEAVGTYNVGFLDDHNFTMFSWCDMFIRYVHLTSASITVMPESTDCNENGVPDEDELESGDCNDNGIFDDCELDSGDCDDDGILDECEPDSDDDGTIDACDGCPDDPNKIEAGLCGCGSPFTDDDCDGVADEDDRCPGLDDNAYAPECADKIPAVSTWGLLVMALLLCAAGKIFFGRRLVRK